MNASDNDVCVVERISRTLARIVFDPLKCGMGREDWIALHARLCRESGGAVFLNLDDMPRGIVSVNWNIAKNDAMNLDCAIDVVVDAIKQSPGIYHAMQAVNEMAITEEELLQYHSSVLYGYSEESLPLDNEHPE